MPPESPELLLRGESLSIQRVEAPGLAFGLALRETGWHTYVREFRPKISRQLTLLSRVNQSLWRFVPRPETLDRSACCSCAQYSASLFLGEKCLMPTKSYDTSKNTTTRHATSEDSTRRPEGSLSSKRELCIHPSSCSTGFYFGMLGAMLA